MRPALLLVAPAGDACATSRSAAHDACQLARERERAALYLDRAASALGLPPR